MEEIIKIEDTDKYERLTDFAEPDRHFLDKRFDVFIKPTHESAFPFCLDVIFSKENPEAILSELKLSGLIGTEVSTKKILSPSPDRSSEEAEEKAFCDSFHETPWGMAFVDKSPHKFEVVWYNKNRADIDTILRVLTPRNFFQTAEGKEEVILRVWHRTTHGIDDYEKRLKALPWAQAKGNYPLASCDKLSFLTELSPAQISGKIILLNGEPGTGKSHFIQSLATEWKKWCRASVIWSPAAFLADETYVFSLVERLKGRREKTKEDAWNLLVMEDAGELVGTDGSLTPGFSTLLNVSDGLLGSGLKFLFVITTNEPISKIHKAVRRPGRLLSHIEIGRFPVSESNTWLEGHGSNARVNEPRTLAELYGILDGNDVETGNRMGFVVPEKE